MTEDKININVGKIKEKYDKAINFLKQKKTINIIIIIFLISLLIGGSWIRLQNLPSLEDSTTGKYIPLALDPFYFLRIAETMVEQSGLPGYDVMRQPSSIFNSGAGVSFTSEIMPGAVVLLYNLGRIVDQNVTVEFIDVISPVIFFILGLIVFFFLVYFLTKSKTAALISSAFLAIIPTYLYRTMAGFSDHESIGMFAFFLALLGYTLALKFLDKQEKKKNHLLKVILFGLLVGFLSAFTIASWGGIASFIFMIIPLSFGIFWLIKTKEPEENKKYLKFYLMFYLIFFISTILFGLLYGFNFSSILNSISLNSNSLINGVVLLFLVLDFLMIKYKDKISFIKDKKLGKYRILFSLLGVIILGSILLALQGTNILFLIPEIINKLLHPFGIGRVGLTVAENAQPYLSDWIGQTGKIFFWLFFGGLITIGINLAMGIKQKKSKLILGALWILFIFGILFSRISSDSILNGTNFISQLFYFGSAILFFGYFIKTYFKEKIEIKLELIIILSWAIFMLIAARGALRTFFVITPFACFSFGLLVVNLSNYMKKSKDELLKMVVGIILISVIIASLFSFYSLTSSTIVQARYTGPSANSQWQNAMAWVRENTPKDSVFAHWWDYGYWVQYLGERPTIADGGHFEGGFRDHLIGRYLLTTPNPETALSFMKTNNVSYLLIDSSDLGKYPAYSSIGSDETGNDRLSQIPIMLSDQNQIQETKTGEIRIYQGGAYLDQDIVYNINNSQIFLPAQRAVIVGIVVETIENKVTNTVSFKQPSAVFIYNNQQYRIPLRYVYFNSQLADFKSGLEAVIMIIPVVSQDTGSIQIDNLGTGIYLSPKVSKSLFAQLYLMNDPWENYPTIKLAHSEQDSIVKILKSQGLETGGFIYFNGFRGPIKIWDTTNIPENILEKEEFLRTSGEYAEFDDLEFVR